MTPEEAVRAAVLALQRDERPPAAPSSPAAMVAYWDRHGGTPVLSEAMGVSPTRRPKPGQPREGYRAYDARRKLIQRWRKGQRQKSPEIGELRHVTALRWAQEHPRRSRRQILAELLRAGCTIDFAGLVQISNDVSWRSHVSAVAGDDPELIAFVAAADVGEWELAGEFLAEAWNHGYGIPYHVSWVEADHLYLKKGKK